MPPPVKRIKSFCVSVVYDPAGPDRTDLSNLLTKMRPIIHRKDILLRQYKAGDTDLEFADPDGMFVDRNPASPFSDATGEPSWYGKQVRVEYLDETGAVIIRHIGHLLQISAGANRGSLRLGNRFQALFARSMLANDVGVIIDTGGNRGMPPVGTGNYINNLTPQDGCGIETWTFTFSDAINFTCAGSDTGYDGAGNTGAPFTSDSGNIVVAVADWTGVFVATNTTSIKSVWRATETTVVNVYEELLLSPTGGNLSPADLDGSIAALKGTMVDVVMTNGFVIDSPHQVITVMEKICLHALAVATEKTDATIGMYAYVPKIEGDVTATLCKHSDLMAASVATTQIYNEFTYRYDYDEINENWDTTVVYPATDAENPSLIKYGRRLPAPQSIDLRGFTAAGNAGWVVVLHFQNYLRWSEPRQIWTVRLKAERMNVEIDELFLIDSAAPDFRQYGEPSLIRRTLLPEPHVVVELYEIGFYVQFEDGCGYMFMDANHEKDNDCWVKF